MPERLKETPVGTSRTAPEVAAITGGTVLELMATLSEAPSLHRPGTPPPTPPVEMSTTTRSGEGYVQIADDSMTDHMYE